MKWGDSLVVDSAGPRESDGHLFLDDLLGQILLHSDTVTRMLSKHLRGHPELPYVCLQGFVVNTVNDLCGEGEDQTTAAPLLKDTAQTTSKYHRAVNQQRARQSVLGICEQIETQCGSGSC